MTSSLTGCSTCSRVFTSRNEIGAVLADQELARAGADVAGLAQDRLGGRVERLDLLVGQERRGRLLDQLLVPALQRAVAGGDHHDVAVGIGQALGLDVPRLVQVALDEALAAAEGADRLAGGGLEQLRYLFQRAGHLQAATTTAVRRLDRDRQPVLLGERDHLGRVGDRVRGTGDQRGADLLRDVPGLDLVAEGVDRGRRRADPDQPGVEHGLGELGVLGQEAVARVHRVRAGAGRDVEDLGDVQVGVRRGRAVQRVRLVGEPDEQRVAVRVGVHGHTGQAVVGGGTDHPDGDLAPVGDQDLGDALAVRHSWTPFGNA